MKSIAVKLVVFFISLICIASILAFMISAIYTGNIKNEIKLNQEAIAISALELERKTDLTIEEIVNIISTKMYDVQIIMDINSFKLKEKELQKIHNNEMVFLSHSRFGETATFLMLDGSYIKISLHSHNNIFKIVASRVGVTLFSYIFIGALLSILLVKSAVEPIIKVTQATQEVAKGNFDIEIESKSKDEIGQLTKNFNKMTRELKNIEYLRKDFISNVSHEFKTPLASIQGFAKLLQMGNLSEEEREEYTNIIVEETKRLSNLSSNMLKLSKLENQEIVENKVRFSLDEQIRKSILLLEYEWDKKNIELDIELDKVEYLGDEELLQQVWINLLSNAIKFSYPNSKVDIRLDSTDSSVIVRISDNGIGMDETIISRVFEKFYQGDKAHSDEGNGLGLALVKRIIDLHGGGIDVESQPQKGSTFTVKLPLQDNKKFNNI